MKNKITAGRKHTFAVLFIIALAIGAAAQALIFNQGDTVQTPDGRTGVIESFKNQEMAKVKFGANDTQYFMLKDLKVVKPPKPQQTGPVESFRVGDIVENADGKQLKIDSISGDSAVVRYGVGKYNVYTLKLRDLVSAKTAAARRENENAGKLVRAQFEDEAKDLTLTIWQLAPAYDTKFVMDTNFDPVPAGYAKMLKDMESLAAVCQKYPNLTNPSNADANSIRQRPADWCEMARQRQSMVKKIRLIVANQDIQEHAQGAVTGIDQTLRNWDGYVKDELQMLVYDRAAWERNNLQTAAKRYAEIGEKTPENALSSADETISELKAKIEQDAAGRSWKQPEYKDAALEALVRAAYQKQFPAIKILKTGMTYATWKAYDDTALVGSNSEYKFYRLDRDKYRQKDGLALVQMPNQTLCQIRVFTLQQTRTGAAFGGAKVAGIGRGGTFVKCP